MHYCVWVSLAKRVAYSAFLTQVCKRRLSYPQVYNIGAAVYCHLVLGLDLVEQVLVLGLELVVQALDQGVLDMELVLEAMPKVLVVVPMVQVALVEVLLINGCKP